MKLPDRPGTYVMTLLLLVLVALAGYLFVTLSSPELQRAVQHARERKAAHPESAH